MITTFSETPPVSIIIPTHNRRPVLPRTLSSLSRQTYPAGKMEVVLVADGCTDDTSAFARNYSAPWALHVLEQPASGPSQSRNRGVEIASSDILIFLDDDMEVSPGFVAAHVRAHQTHPYTVAVGVLKPPHGPRNYFERSLYDWWDGKYFQMRQPGYRFRYDDVFGGNLSMRADLFRQVGGFDPGLRCHEDYELGVRLLGTGAIGMLAREAEAIHHDITDISRSFQRRVAEAQADVYLIRRHAGLQTHIPLTLETPTISDALLQHAAVNSPLLGTVLARLGQHALPWLESFWMFYFWQILFYLLLEYWYWRGVGTEIGLQELRTLRAVKDEPVPELLLDLNMGIDLALQCVDEAHPTSARIFVGRQWVGDIPHRLGDERLRGEHLRPLLVTRLAEALRVAVALDVLELKSADPGQDDAWRRAWVNPFPKVNPLRHTPHPMKVLVIDLANRLTDVNVEGFAGLHALVHSGGRPLGCITLTDLHQPVVTEAMLRSEIARNLGKAAIELAWGVLFPTPAHCPPISVVVCTRNRTTLLAECLQALFDMKYADFEILVIDNAPDDEQTAKLTAGMPVRYIREDRPGLNWARNRGIREARHAIVAFTDDDTRPDRDWLRAVGSVFHDDTVMAVTGSVLPVRLDTQAQNLFEFRYGGMNHGFTRRIITRSTSTPTRLLWASAYGVGANMAFRKEVFEKLGDFDVALDVGTPSAGGGDVEMFHRLVAAGHTLVYEPSALIWHNHRPEMADLVRLVQNNGRSFGCYLLTCAHNRTVGIGAIVYFALRFWLWGWIVKRLLSFRSGGFPKRLVWQELFFALGSPLAYLRSQRHARRIAAKGCG